MKSSQAEVRALAELLPHHRDRMLPAIELTRSRKSKNNPEGSLSRKLEQVYGALGDQSAIFDLCTEDDLINGEIEQLFESNRGYRNWTDFVTSDIRESDIPCVMYNGDGDKRLFQKQIERLLNEFEQVCLRFPAEDSETEDLIRWALEVNPDTDTYYTIGSVYFAEYRISSYYEGIAERYVSNRRLNRPWAGVSTPVSGYPKQVGVGSYGGDEEGSFPAAEIAINDALRRKYRNVPFIWSDYASIHPIRYDTPGFNWVPRVDTIVGDEYHYARRRRNDTGYVGAATSIVSSHGLPTVPCWARDEIEEAAAGTPNGRSPSYWISVRANLWMSTMMSRLAV